MSETSGSGFGKFVPGFDFLQNLAGQAADGVAQGLGKSIPQLPNLGNWVAPTFNVEDLEKRIEELKAVHFWLDQNAKALGATIQALEVQKMTLATLQTMNFSLGDVANALKLKAADTVAGLTGRAPAEAPSGVTAAATVPRFAGLEVPPRTYGTTPAGAAAPLPAPKAAARPRKPRSARGAATAASSAPVAGVVDPMHWWGALTQQFQGIAANAMKDVARQTTLDSTRQMASGLTEQAVRTATGVVGKVTRSVGGKSAAKAGQGQAAPRPAARPPRKAPASTRKPAAPAPAPALKGGEWPMPGGLFQVPGFLGGAPAPAPAPAPAGRSRPARKAPAAGSTPSRKTGTKPAGRAKRPATAPRRRSP